MSKIEKYANQIQILALKIANECGVDMAWDDDFFIRVTDGAARGYYNAKYHKLIDASGNEIKKVDF